MNSLKTGLVEVNDKDKVRSLTQKSHEETIFGEITFSNRKFNRAFNHTIDDPEHYLGLKVELGEQIVGCCYCMLGGYYIGEGARVVTVNSVFVDSDIRSTIMGGKVAIKLLRGIEHWARRKKAHVILYHVTAGRGIASTDSFFRKMGMTTLGGNYGIKI